MIAVGGVSKEFGGVKALDAVTLTAESGEIVALVGPAGAGKTTLIDIVSGASRPASGSVTIGGVRIDGLPPYRIAAHGLTRTHQRPRVFPRMTLFENVMAGLYRRPERRGQRASAARELLETFGLLDRAHEPAQHLDEAGRRTLEIARALAFAPAVLLLDEPFAGLDEDARSKVTVQLQRAASAAKTAVIVAERDLVTCAHLCARAFVLHAGTLIAHGATARLAADPDVRDAYLGVEWRQ